jgi:hypothetical protein
LNEQEAEDIDQPFDEEENTANRREKAPRGPRFAFPTEDEFHAGYIWGYDAYFQASIDHIRPVQHVETNHRCLSQQRVREMYMRLAGNEASLVTPLTLRPIAYIMEEVGPNDERRSKEVPFRASHTVKEFKTAYLQNASVVLDMPAMNRIHWLENNIIWEPVDGQHIVAACLRAQRENEKGVMSNEEFRTKFAQRKAKFIVINNPKLYIEVSVRINAKEFEREFYTTMYKDMVKLFAIWVACGKPNPKIRGDDARRADAITLSASALHWMVPLAGKSSSLGVLAKRMLEYTHHAWQEDDACYNAVLQIYKDYEGGILWYSAADQKKWRAYA